MASGSLVRSGENGFRSELHIVEFVTLWCCIYRLVLRCGEVKLSQDGVCTALKKQDVLQ